MKRGYDARVEALLDRLGPDLTEQDFADLGMACLDQAGLSIADQISVATMLNGRRTVAK